MTIYEMSDTEIDVFVKKHLPVKLKEKDKYGEVFTPPQFIDKILDLFPKTVWSNPRLKWLDPTAGVGFFMIMIYQRLMKGLTAWEPNPKKRSDHIIKNMLYMVELNKANCRICRRLFGPKSNIVCADFLSDFTFPNNAALAFNCIVGNPPFQDDYGLNEAGNRILGGKNKLYERIFLKAFNVLADSGYLSFIVPDNMFSGNGSEAYKIIIRNAVPFVSFSPSNQTYFPTIQQYVCYFLLHKVGKRIETTIETNENETFRTVLEDRPVNPIRDWTLRNERLLKRFVSNERNEVIYNRGKNINSYKGNKYPVVYTPSKMLYTNNPDLAVGLNRKKAIVFAISVDLAFTMDYNGTLGAGPNTFIIPFRTNAEGKRLERFLKSDDYKTLALATKTTRQYLKLAFIEHLKLTKIMGKFVSKTRKNSRRSNKTRKRS